MKSIKSIRTMSIKMLVHNFHISSKVFGHFYTKINCNYPKFVLKNESIWYEFWQTNNFSTNLKIDFIFFYFVLILYWKMSPLGINENFLYKSHTKIVCKLFIEIAYYHISYSFFELIFIFIIKFCFLYQVILYSYYSRSIKNIKKLW